jgi:hypothetical protein
MPDLLSQIIGNYQLRRDLQLSLMNAVILAIDIAELAPEQNIDPGDQQKVTIRKPSSYSSLIQRGRDLLVSFIANTIKEKQRDSRAWFTFHLIKVCMT